MVDWQETGELRRTLASGDAYVIRSDPLSVLVTCACQGHEGDVAEMTIRLASGVEYAGAEIRRLAARPDRPR